MEYNFYIEKPIQRDELHQSIIDILKELSNKEHIDGDDVISCYPLQLFIYGPEYGADYVKEEFGFELSWELTFEVFSKNETDNEVENLRFFFKVINYLVEKFDINIFVLEDTGGTWIMKSLGEIKQLRDTDIFNYPFELLKCSSDFERCEAKQFG
ncbi:hypothetical protein [Ruminococcus albus]|uniref:Uncharacterized protein n=1 Tax=Ruminococcus albus (strain ATCC 27210 / DSM 20455 / JCM 14654 / NCDO 2250 / 7) TaxID=697329 RepID=E6UHA1_RUMA7|nr:hypothetical protein [Ruminococcus albus]ADU23179.1 hypothetical protein Rumal_2707 [Ruminococcus albus 7 = DSM 20455]